jgi:hypothetical protein
MKVIEVEMENLERDNLGYVHLEMYTHTHK